jgi:hypothetical protein
MKKQAVQYLDGVVADQSTEGDSYTITIEHNGPKQLDTKMPASSPNHLESGDRVRVAVPADADLDNVHTHFGRAIVYRVKGEIVSVRAPLIHKLTQLLLGVWMIGVMLLSWIVFLGPAVSTLERHVAPFHTLCQMIRTFFGAGAS